MIVEMLKSGAPQAIQLNFRRDAIEIRIHVRFAALLNPQIYGVFAQQSSCLSLQQH